MSPSWYSAFLLSSDKKAWRTSGRFEQVTKSNKHMGEKQSKHRGVQSLIIFLFTFYCLKQTLHKNQNMVVFNVSLSVIPLPLTRKCNFRNKKYIRKSRLPFCVKETCAFPNTWKSKRITGGRMLAGSCAETNVGLSASDKLSLFCVILRFVPSDCPRGELRTVT